MVIQNPRVSIGLPVFNGEAYLREAIDSLLVQTFTDFELIISDNASIDKTEEICKEYSIKDNRIRYYRNEQNIGAIPNHNLTFQLSRGEFFKWAAHDDLHSPDYLQRCVEILQQDESVILCYAKTTLIDKDGKIVGKYNATQKADSLKPNERFRDIILYEYRCYQIYGVMRSSILKKVPPLGNFQSSDNAFLARLSLLGRFYEIPEYLFFNRRHSMQGSAIVAEAGLQAYGSFFSSKQDGSIDLPRWRMLKKHCASVWDASLSWHERLSCWRHIPTWLYEKRHGLKEDLLAAAKYFVHYPN
ncbi:glycosyltransferase family 2 protein [Leptothermofonsia sp. ETS-13]|uniref:glycosyltransferase family 2 protein n=1 Tax=Leptothermofonsia sp. ETS-13 TaxID=3035696 RepID=UPI003BA04C99